MKQVGGWCRKGGGRIPDTVVDEKGQEHTGQDVLRVWRDSFFQLGVENLDDQDFDHDFAKDVEAEVKRLEQGREETEDEYEEERKESEEERKIREKEKKRSERLNEEITQKEVDKAINQLKNDRAAGTDRILGEVMKEGGDMLRLAVWKMCSEAWRIEKVPGDWMQGVIFPLYKEGTTGTL